jgi:hypothetical protein
MKIRAAAIMVLTKVVVQWLIDHLCPDILRNAVPAESIVLRNHRLRQAPKRYAQL